MKWKIKKNKRKQSPKELPATLLYPREEDIYVQFDKEIEIDSEDILNKK